MSTLIVIESPCSFIDTFSSFKNIFILENVALRFSFFVIFMRKIHFDTTMEVHFWAVLPVCQDYVNRSID